MSYVLVLLEERSCHFSCYSLASLNLPSTSMYLSQSSFLVQRRECKDECSIITYSSDAYDGFVLIWICVDFRVSNVDVSQNSFALSQAYVASIDQSIRWMLPYEQHLVQDYYLDLSFLLSMSNLHQYQSLTLFSFQASNAVLPSFLMFQFYLMAWFSYCCITERSCWILSALPAKDYGQEDDNDSFGYLFDSTCEYPYPCLMMLRIIWDRCECSALLWKESTLFCC